MSGIKNRASISYKIVESFESAIHTGESHIRDLVERAKTVNDQFADGRTGNLAVVALLDFVGHFVGDALEVFILNGALVAGAFQAEKKLGAVKWNAAAIALNDGQPDSLFDPFVSRESLIAGDAKPPSADGAAALTSAGVDDLQTLFLGIAEGASHWRRE